MPACANKGLMRLCFNMVEQGVPACANKGLLTDILRGQWNFSGFVVSDYDAWAGIERQQKYVTTMEDAAAAGINAGLDQVCFIYFYLLLFFLGGICFLMVL